MIEFVEQGHRYLKDGELVPSVSDLVNYALGNPYKYVPADVLNRAAEYGTRVHAIITDGEAPQNEDEEEALKRWEWLKEHNGIEIESCEKIVACEDYAGRYDMIAKVNGTRSLLDIKTNTNYPAKHLRVQMGLYLYALGEDLPCFCVWLPRKNEFPWCMMSVDPISADEVEALICAYKQNKAPVSVGTVKDSQIYTEEETGKIRRFYALKKEVEEIEKRGREKALQIMRENGVKSFENQDLKVSFINASTRKQVDAEALKRDGLWEKYTKEVPVAESIRITWQKA